MQNSGISSQICSLLNNEEFRPTANLIVSTCSASDYLENVKPNLEKITTNYYETFSITDKFTGYFSDITVITNPEDLTAGSSSIQGKRGTENIGIAVFNDDKLCGKLTATETICHLLINNDVNSFVISIDNPCSDKEKNKIELNIVPNKKSKISVNIEDGIPNIYTDINVQASILTLEKNMEYENTDTLNKFSAKAEEYLQKQLTDYFNKISKDYNTDIDCFSYKALSHFPTQKDWKDYNWKENFKNSRFHTNVKINVVSSQMITKT